MKKRILFVTVIALVIVIATCIGVGFYEHQQNIAEAVQEATTEQELEELQQKLLAELSSKEGDYDDRQIVLYGTSNSEAKELAEMFGAELRITKN